MGDDIVLDAMTPEDHDLLFSLRQQQATLQQTLEKLNAQLSALEARAGTVEPEIFPTLPPLPQEISLPPLPPAAEVALPSVPLPPIPPAPASQVTSGLPPVPPSKPSFEYHFGRGLIRIGALLSVIILALLLAMPKVQVLLGHVGLLALSAAAGIFVVILAERLERQPGLSLFFGRMLTALALAWLYLTAYASFFYQPLRAVGSPLVAGFLLLLWAVYGLLLAERKKSQVIACLAIALALVGTALNPVGSFTMAANLLLAFAAVFFLLRNGWAAVATFSLIGTYWAFLHRLVIDENGNLVLDTSRTLPFWPFAVYLVGAWFLFTAAVVLTTSPSFRGGKRLVFLSLNNVALAGLLALTAYIAGYGARAIGWTLLDSGLVFLVTSRFAGFADIEPVDVMGAYAAQGLALITAGTIVIYTGLTRALLLLIETFLLGVAGAFSGDRILTISTYVSAFFTTVFLVWEIAINAHHPWVLGFGGAVVMLINAWASRGEIRHSPRARGTIVVSTSCYCAMAVGLIYAGISTVLTDPMVPPALALAALVLTFAIYHFSIFELPPLAQVLLLAAQARVLFPLETGEELPWWSTAWVAAITLLLVSWWSRQRLLRTGLWTTLLTLLYALALVRLTSEAVRPYLDAEGWMIGASLLSVAFLVYGAFTRVWAIAAAGQVFLGLALYHFFFPPDKNIFPWTWWSAAVPVTVLFSTARGAQEWLRLFPEISDPWRKAMAFVSCGYLLLALAALLRGVFAVVPELDQIAAFLFLGTLMLSLSVRRFSSFGVRCSFILSATGLGLYLQNFSTPAHAMATFLNAFALFLCLTQTALLGHEGKSLVTILERGGLILLSVTVSWIFVSAWVSTRLGPGSLTMVWSFLALFLFLFGLLVREILLRRCGLAILLAAIVRLFCCDLWVLSGGYRVLTSLLLLAFIAFGGGSILLRRHGRAPWF